MEYQQQETPDYNYNDYDQNDGYNPANNAVKGLRIAIILLLIVLGAVLFLYWRSVQVSKEEEKALQTERDTLQSQVLTIQKDMELIKFDNDTLNQHLALERHRADSLFQRMKKDSRVSYAKIKAYERELGTLRSTMQTFVRQIDSLNRLNQKLVGENLAYRKELSTYRLRTEVAEEKASELNSKVSRGSVIRARDITLRAVNAKGKDVTRAAQAKRLVTTFILSSNELAQPAERNVYSKIVSPDGIVLAETQGSVFNFEGQNIPFTATRSVDYQGEDLSVSLFYSGSGIISGQYTVMVYMDGHLIGQNSVILR